MTLTGETPDQETFRTKLAALLNMHSKENGSDTPDHILAVYLIGCLGVFDAAVTARDKWNGVSKQSLSEHLFPNTPTT